MFERLLYNKFISMKSAVTRITLYIYIYIRERFLSKKLYATEYSYFL